MMISYQPQAVWELCRQGYQEFADEAEKRWNAGKIYHPEGRIRMPRELRNLIEQCNYEVSVMAERRNYH